MATHFDTFSDIPSLKSDVIYRRFPNWIFSKNKDRVDLQSNEASGQSQLRVMNIGHASNQPNRKWQLQTSDLLHLPSNKYILVSISKYINK